MRGGPTQEARKRIDRYPKLVLGINVFLLICIIYYLYRVLLDPGNIDIGPLLIVISALVPGYLWSTGRRSGLPIVPLHTLSLTWAFALPLVAGHPRLKFYNDDEIFFAALSVALYALSATASWYLVTRQGYKVRKAYFVIPEKHGYKFSIFALVLGGIFTKLVVGGVVNLGPGVYAIVRSSILSFMVIAMFVLAYQMGRGELTRFKTGIFVIAAIFCLIIQLTTLYMIGAISSMAIALVGYAVGKRSIPWIGILLTILVFGILQAGKYEIREQYSFLNPRPITLIEVPVLIADWTTTGVSHLLGNKDERIPENPIYQRVSLIHLLLFVQRATPRDIPYMEGATYWIIPGSVVPRILNPDKLSPHTGNRMLNIYYALQSEKGTLQTTIGWGLMNEAYANFGITGIIGVGFIMGLLFGLVGRWTAGAPILSLQNLVGIIFITTAIQTENTMGVLAAVIVQSLSTLILLAPLLVKRTSDFG